MICVAHFPQSDVVRFPIREAELHPKGVEQSQFLKIVIF